MIAFHRFVGVFSTWAIILQLFTSIDTCHAGMDSFVELPLRLLKAYPSWRPRGVLDIGANVGKWSTGIRQLYPDSKILMLEASDQHDAKLRKTVNNIKNAKYRIQVISDHDGDVIPFYFNPKASTGNSMFQENTAFFTDVKPVNKTALTLDTIVKEEENTFLRKESGSTVFDFIKVDVQGAELMVLKGGLKTLRAATFVQFEGSTIEYNSGGSCFHEIDEFLRSHGFYYYDHGSDLRHPGLFKTHGLGQWDILYVNPDSENLPSELKKLGPNYCGSSSEKKKKSTEAYSEPLYGGGSNYDMDTLTGFCQKDFFTWIFGVMVGLFLGRLVNQRGKNSFVKNL